MKTVAVLGGGPAGSFAAERLARGGVRTLLFDEKLAWEKPCGGGLTYKAYQEYPYLLENGTPKKVIAEACLAAPKAGDFALRLAQPLVIYSRYDLNKMLLERAAAAGAELEQTRVLGLERRGAKWTVRTKHGAAEADECVIATGARNPLREVGTEYRAGDTMLALGYFVDGELPRVDIQFLPQLEGYIWVFPRCGHSSVGIGGKGAPAHVLRARLEQYMREKGLKYEGARFFSHMLPSLNEPSWKTNRVAGEGWYAVGDAAGLVDPVTGEGLYYAMRSGDLASQILLADSAPEQRIGDYRTAVRREFAADLEYGSHLAERFFAQRFLFSTMPARMIQFMRWSPRFRTIVEDLFAGTQNYLGLKPRLIRSLNGTLQDLAMNFFLQRFVPQVPGRR